MLLTTSTRRMEEPNSPLNGRPPKCSTTPGSPPNLTSGPSESSAGKLWRVEKCPMAGPRTLKSWKGFSGAKFCQDPPCAPTKSMRYSKIYYYGNVCKTSFKFKPVCCLQIMRLTWAQNPDDRPAFRAIKEQLIAITQTLDWKTHLPRWYYLHVNDENSKAHTVIQSSSVTTKIF